MKSSSVLSDGHPASSICLVQVVNLGERYAGWRLENLNLYAETGLDLKTTFVMSIDNESRSTVSCCSSSVMAG